MLQAKSTRSRDDGEREGVANDIDITHKPQKLVLSLFELRANDDAEAGTVK